MVKKETAIVPITEYRALATNPKKVLAVIMENMGGEQITDRDLDRVTLPLGGATTWEVEGLEGSESMKELTGVIVHWTRPRAYWAMGLDEGDGPSPPDCFSDDGEIGIGDPGGDCFTCPLNQWDSAEKGKGKACKEKRLLFFLRAGDILPIVIQAPATSIANLKRYFLRLASQGIPYSHVQTTLTLAKQSGTFPYSKIEAKSAGIISSDRWDTIDDYVRNIKPLVDRNMTLIQDE